MTTPIATIDETGIHVPDFATVLAYFKDRYRSIYGADVYLENDSQDGQWLALIALALNDANAMAAAAYNSFSPTTAQGVGLSTNVKINGISRALPTYSAVDLLIVGQAGAIITRGVAQDDAGNKWDLPASVVIPIAGQITVTAIAQQIGAVKAVPNSITQIATPTRGWQSVTNPGNAVAGAPVESDALLRRRQKVSTALPSQTIIDGVLGAVAAVSGVTRYKAYENDSSIADASGIPGHTLALVVEGGDPVEIATRILRKKTPGVGTYGTTVENVVDAYGIPHVVRFFRPTVVQVGFAITVRALNNFTFDVQTAIQNALAAWASALDIGQPVYLTRAYVPANLIGAQSATFEILSLAMGRNGASPTAADVAIAFNESAYCDPANVIVTVTT
jgi:uncharacterized phage protein gp47/JayE